MSEKIELTADRKPPRQPLKPTPPKIKKVALVGTAASSVNEAPFGEPDFEIWGLAWRVLPRMTRAFDMHPMINRRNVPKNYIELLAGLERPIYMQKAHASITSSISYPLDEIVTFLGPKNFGETARGGYFASSFAYKMALAIYEGFDEIHSYGYDMLEDSEYGYQRPNAEYLIGLARGMGRTVVLAEGCAMCRFNHLYGYEEWQAGIHQALSNAEVDKRLDALAKQHSQKAAEMHMAAGMIEEAKNFRFLLNQVNKGGQYHAPKKK